jgi:hypothetical protein
MQRTGEYEHMRLGYQKLHKEVNRINAIMRRAGHGEFKKMPFEWVDQHSTYRQDRVIGLPSGSQPIGVAANTSAKTSRGAGQKTSHLNWLIPSSKSTDYLCLSQVTMV